MPSLSVQYFKLTFKKRISSSRAGPSLSLWSDKIYLVVDHRRSTSATEPYAKSTFTYLFFVSVIFRIFASMHLTIDVHAGISFADVSVLVFSKLCTLSFQRNLAPWIFLVAAWLCQTRNAVGHYSSVGTDVEITNLALI